MTDKKVYLRAKEDLKALAAEGEGLLAKAEAESRDLTVDEAKREGEISGEFERLQGVVARYERQRDRDLAAAALKSAGAPLVEPLKGEEEARGFKTIADQALAVLRFKATGDLDPRLGRIHAATGLSEGVAADGGFLVEKTLVPEFIRPMWESGAILSRVRKIPTGPNSNGIKINAIDETSRATGSRGGGVQGYWLAEAATKTKSKPKFRQIALEYKKVAALVAATDEVLSDANALEGIIRSEVPAELTFQAENAIIRGTGAGQPLGILNSGALVTQTKVAAQAATTVVAGNIASMYGRLHPGSVANAVWFHNQDVFNQFPLMSISNMPVFVPPTGFAAAPFGTLFGRPLQPIEYASTLGTVGDLILADFSQYIVIERPIEAAVSIHVLFEADETLFRFVYRIDGQPAWNSAVTPFQGTATQSPFIVVETRA